MLTVANSVYVLMTGPTAEPRTLLDLTTQTGTAFHYSTEAFSYGGTYYEARLQGTPEIQTELGPAGLVGPRTVTIPLANADGFFSQQPPSTFRASSLAIRQVFREFADLSDANSLTLWRFNLQVTGAQMQSPELYQIEADDPLARIGQQFVPNADLTITRSLFPNVPNDSPGLGRPIPITFGWALCPLYLVGENVHSSALDTGAAAYFTVCMEDPTFTPVENNGVYQLFDQELIPVQSYGFFTADVGSYSIVMMRQASSPRIGGRDALLPHYAFLTHDRMIDPAGPGDTTQPSPVNHLLDLLTNSYLGNLPSRTLVDSPSFTAAYSYFIRLPHQFHGVLTERRPLQSVLDDWSYGALAHLSLREQLRLIVQQSRAAVYSFHAGNILQKTLTMRDRPLSELNTVHRVIAQAVFSDVASAPQYLSVNPTLTTFAAGSDGTSERENLFLGWTGAAKRATQLWAKRDATAVREYRLESTLRAGHLEEGDLVTLSHSLYMSSGTQLCEVVGITRGETLRFVLHQASAGTFAVTDVGSLTFFGINRANFVRYGGGETAINSAGTTFTSSHSLIVTPTFVQARLLERFVQTTINSLVTANDSQFTTWLWSSASFNASPNLQGWSVARRT